MLSILHSISGEKNKYYRDPLLWVILSYFIEIKKINFFYRKLLDVAYISMRFPWLNEDIKSSPEFEISTQQVVVWLQRTVSQQIIKKKNTNQKKTTENNYSTEEIIKDQPTKGPLTFLKKNKWGITSFSSIGKKKPKKLIVRGT